MSIIKKVSGALRSHPFIAVAVVATAVLAVVRATLSSDSASEDVNDPSRSDSSHPPASQDNTPVRDGVDVDDDATTSGPSTPTTDSAGATTEVDSDETSSNAPDESASNAPQ